jgi:uncharacterized membrane protein YcaP (DUF421 family)
VLLVIVSEAISQGLNGGDDFSLTSSVLLVGTFVALDILLSHLKSWFRPLDNVLEGVPVLLIENGELVRSNMKAERVDEEDIMESARSSLGLARLDQVKYAILERNGSISIIPAQPLSR